MDLVATLQWGSAAPASRLTGLGAAAVARLDLAMGLDGMMDWPLIGRDAVLRRLTTVLDRTTASSLTITGAEGVGKTRLAAELAHAALARGRAVDSISASSSAALIPFGALAHLLALPAASADESWLMRNLLAELQRRGNAAGPLVLIVDDAHHLDEHSAALIHQAANHRVLSAVLTARHGEPMPQVLTQLWKDSIAERVEIGPLTRQSSIALIETALEGPVDGLTLSELWQRSGGNPLFLRELVLGGLESGALIREGDIWRATRPLAPSSRLSELVRGRLGRLAPAEQQVVEALAVADSVDLRTLELLGSAEAIEALEERQLIEVERSGNRSAVRLGHPIYGEVVAADMPRSRSRRIMLSLADHIEAHGAMRPDDLLRIALWRLDGGGAGEPALLLAAARRALAVFDGPLAERLARAATTVGEDDPTLLRVLGQALAVQQRVEEADEVLSRAAEQASSDDDVAQVVLARANLLYFRAGRTTEAARLLAEALDRLTNAAWRDEIESLLILFRSAAGQLRAVAAAGRRLVQQSEARPRAVVHTLLYSSIANVMLGRFSEAEEQVRLGIELAPQVREELPLSGEMLHINGVMANAYAGRHARALELGVEGHRRALDARVPEVAAMWGMNLAECQLLAGDIETALRSMLGALAVVRDRDPFSVHGIDSSVASVCASWLGRHDLARELRQEVVDLDLARDVRSRIWLDRATVWTTWHEAGAVAAAQMAMDAGGRAVVDTHLVWGAWLFHDAARLGLAPPAANRLDALASRIEGDLVPTMALHVRALASSDALGLERAASAFDQLGSRLFAAEAAAQAHQAYLRQGRMRLARVAAARAAFLASQCASVRTPALVDAAPMPLTPRELEIARLAAGGLSSRELADRLGISVRTVDNHLGTIYDKLGVAGRAELPDILGATALHSP